MEDNKQDKEFEIWIEGYAATGEDHWCIQEVVTVQLSGRSTGKIRYR